MFQHYCSWVALGRVINGAYKAGKEATNRNLAKVISAFHFILKQCPSKVKEFLQGKELYKSRDRRMLDTCFQSQNMVTGGWKLKR